MDGRPAHDALREEPIDWRFKGFPPTDGSLRICDLAGAGWNLLEGDLLLPALVLKRRALDHNLELMANWCRDRRVDLAPHAKTSMSPELLIKHADAGAWGFTVATVSQARTLHTLGFRRLLLASQLVERRAVEWVSQALDEDDEFVLFSLVDSTDGVQIMEETLERAGARRPFRVLVEFGQRGGRTGCRSPDEAFAVAKAVHSAPHLELAGVEGFEGLIDAGSPDATLAAVDRFLVDMREVALRLAEQGAFDHLDEVMVTAGGSAYFDRVVHHLSDFGLDRPVRTILRSGGYATHDAEMYEEVSPLAARSAGGPRLEPALELWAAVWSRPEPELAILGMGKRDAAYDYRLPVPTVVRSRDGQGRCVQGSLRITALNDQHAYVHLPADDPLAPGDLVGCGISHPCAAFDKWRLIPVVDDHYNVVDAMSTLF